MTPTSILIVLFGYFAVLIGISYLTGRKGDNDTFFTGNKNSPWFVVAFGMIGATLSGVTFISIPGVVVSDGFSYMQMVLGYLAGYLIISQVLIPLYYRRNLTSIYGFLEQEFGFHSYKTGAAFFLISRVIGAAFRLYLVAFVLDEFVFAPFGVPFWLTVALTIVLIWLYSFRGGIKTIVWTDTLQTTFMLLAVCLAIYFISQQMDWTLAEALKQVRKSEYSNWWVSDWSAGNHWLKHFFSGMLITVVMTGLDQDMMQKNLTCRNEKDAQKNIRLMSLALVPVNLIFLSLGALLYIYGESTDILSTVAQNGFPLQIFDTESGEFVGAKKDQLFPALAIQHLNPVVGLVFTIGLIAAAYSSADSALTALTTSFCVDFLGIRKGNEGIKTRYLVHIGFSTLLFIVIIIFKSLHNDSIINQLFTAAGYTYGPILGLFALGILTKIKPRDAWVPFIAVFSALASYGISHWADVYYDFSFGFLILLVNGMITFLLLILSSRLVKNKKHQEQ